MLLNFCLGCKKKKIASQSDQKLDDDDSIETICLSKANFKSSNAKQIKSANKTNLKSIDQIDSQLATSPSSICKFQNETTNLQTPIHSLNNDGSIRIKSNAINRALPDIPISDLLNMNINTSINSTGSAINRSINDRSLTPPLATSFNITNLNQSSQDTIQNSKFNCMPTSTSTFNPINLHHTVNLSDLDNQTDHLNELNSKLLQDQRHHSYARIKDNVVVDSSTENDTDDYYDSAIVTKRGLDLQKVTINVPSANHLNQLNNQISNQQTAINNQVANCNQISSELTTSLYAVSGNLSRITNLELPYHISTINDVTTNSTIAFTNSNFNQNQTNQTNSTNVYDLSADEEPAKEVSYNKISVREPLAKVLQDRANLIEHHYTEVYDENNSFYEEIAGSTNSSVTYTKIGDLTFNQNNLNIINNTANQMPPQIPIETSLLTIHHSSRSTSPMQTMPILQTFMPQSNLSNNNHLQSSSFATTSSHQQQQPINCEALYTQVNKLAKTNNKNKFLMPQQQQQNINDLYAKVQKNLKINHSAGQTSNNNNKKIHSSTPDMNNLHSASLASSSLLNIKERPPLPPPLDNIPKLNLFTIKSNTNLTYQEPSTSYQHNQFNLNVYPQHKRSFSSGSQYQDTDSDYYETFPSNSKLIDNHHNYETVKKKCSDDKLNDDEKEIIDAGYEIIKASKDSDEDSPCYETISPSKQLVDECISEPDYEIIKNVNKMASTFKGNQLKLTRNENDASTDPGYERIKHTEYSKKQKIDEFNEDYEVINKDYEVINKNHFIERL